MVGSVQNVNSVYPDVWVRWVTQQVRIAVSFELSTAEPDRWPHLRRLPLAIHTDGADGEAFLRELITTSALHGVGSNADDRIDTVVTAVLADEAVAVAEPDL